MQQAFACTIDSYLLCWHAEEYVDVETGKTIRRYGSDLAEEEVEEI